MKTIQVGRKMESAKVYAVVSIFLDLKFVFKVFVDQNVKTFVSSHLSRKYFAQKVDWIALSSVGIKIAKGRGRMYSTLGSMMSLDEQT